MPEGDTVWRAARLLDRTLAGRTLTATDFRVPQLATRDLAGATVRHTASRGKHLLTRIEADRAWTLHTHLKMEGAWQAYGPGQRWRRPVHTARVVLEAGERTAVGFSLGIVELVPTGDEHEVVGHLGPDLLGPDWDEAEALRRLTEDPDRPLVHALLDQTRLAGIGNMYAAELCFTSGVRPTTPVARVPDLTRLVRRAKLMLEHNKERAEQSTTGDLRRGRRTWVYRQRQCLRCGTTVSVEQSGPPGKERATYWCPRCQPDR
ncbi:DNA-formamidopyrimidine glycosylase family protein [Nocardioides solisilvae]|uniref:DNA-formamidopyrimidine glycosylase family protein n=1 Tax=Nocardioides solisilvae TaxID=1542435 RepID=UPI000D74BBB7|nr:DNA-formamidopyrimidine glycosylase family protein [Nocardioides solisilvae]